MKKTLAAFAVSTAMLATPAFAQCDDGEQVVKFSHVVAATGHPKGEAAQRFAERVNEEMDGTMCMEVYPNTQLYDDDKVMEALLLGDVQLAAPSLSKFEAYTLKFRLFDLPFLFASLDQTLAFGNSEAGQNLLTSMEDQGFTGLGYWLSGMKQFSANKPLEVPEDASGLKFRIQTSDVAEAMIAAMNANAQKLAFSEVYGALQTGVVDGQENSWCNIYTQKFFEVQDGITETNHASLAYLLVTSTEWLESLDEETREQFMTIMQEVTDEANQNVANQEEECRQRIADSGETLRELSDEQREQWVEAMQPVWEQFRDDIGQDLIDAAEQAGS